MAEHLNMSYSDFYLLSINERKYIIDKIIDKKMAEIRKMEENKAPTALDGTQKLKGIKFK